MTSGVTSSTALPPSNPFVASRFAPGVVPWISDDPDEIARWFDRASHPGARHQVTGPHGSGKSSLFAHLERHGRMLSANVLRVRGSALGAEHLRALVRMRGEPTSQRQLVLLDEGEEVSRATRLIIQWLARKGGFVVSTHRDLGLPSLAHRAVDAKLASMVVTHLLGPRGTDHPTVDLADVGYLLDHHDGNLREVLFALYDAFEAERVDGRRASAGWG